MNKAVIPFHRPYYGQRARDLIDEALRQGSLHGEGKSVEAVESRLAELTGTKHAMLTPSCTSALEIAARVAGFGPGDEVIVPGYTFVSSASAMSATGARPIFVDVDRANLCIDLDAAERAVTPRTKGIVAVHYAGQSCDIGRLRDLAQRYGLIVIEDAAQALFCTQGDHRLGAVGHFGCYSFHDSKVFSAGEGGALLVNDARFLRAAIQVREKGTNRRDFLEGKVDKYGWVRQGTSALMGGLPATLLGAQFEERDAIIARRQEIFDVYDRDLRPLAEARGWHVIRRAPEERLTSHIYWMMCRDETERREFGDTLRARGIIAAPHYPALHRSTHVRDMGWEPATALEASEHAATALTRLPLFTQMSEADVLRVVEAVRAFLQANA